jgi:trehalose synthase
MAQPIFVNVQPQPIARFEPLLGDSFAAIEAAAAEARRRLQDIAVWNVNSTARGGGVAEMLHALLPYVRDAGIDTRWAVLREPPEFFELTKRIHNNLHGDHGDGGVLGPEQRALYEHSLAKSAGHLAPLVQKGDVVLLHDPQTAGLARPLKEAGARVIWRCHVGCDHPNQLARRAWDFLTPYIEAADVFVFSRRAYIWDTLDGEQAWVMAPCIDPFSAKNREMDRTTVDDILGAIGLGDRPPKRAPTFERADDTPARVERPAEILQEARLPHRAPAVIQISRWDRLKDHLGLLRCFEEHICGADGRLHLVLAGPSSAGVADDPEGAAVWHELGRAWRELPGEARGRTHLISLPMDNLDENAAMVNALQRHADIVVQKSIAEGFGLTVAEAMWKRRPVIGTRVGGIQDQIVDGVSGVLVEDPRDLETLGRNILALTAEPERAAEMGERARLRVTERFLAATRLAEYAELVARLGSGSPA